MTFLEALKPVLLPFVGSQPDYLFSLTLFAFATFVSMKKGLLFRMKGFIAFIAFCIGLRYLAWRGIFTLNDEDAITLTTSSFLYLAEIYLFLTLLLSYIRGFNQKISPSKTVHEKDFPTVGILIKMKDQPLDALYRTLVCCDAITYPSHAKKITILSDQYRAELKRLSDQFHCRYSHGLHDKKNGRNLFKDAFAEGTPFTMVLEAGDIPLSSFLIKVMTAFQDKKVAFVQTVVRSLTADPFQQALFLKQEIAHEQEYFYKVVAPDLEKRHAALPSKRGVVFRSAALEDVPDFRNDCQHSDLDLALSARLHRRGWRSTYLDQTLFLLTLTEAPKKFFQKRAGRILSAIKLLLRGLPLWPGLSLGQRIAYLHLLMADLLVLPRVLFMIAPIGFLAGFPPLRTSLPMLMAYAAPFYFWQMLARYARSNRRRHPLWSAVYETADLSVLSINRPKSEGKLKRFLSIPILPFLFLGGLQLAGLALGVFQFTSGRLTWQSFMLGGLWVFYNLFLLTGAAASVHGRPHKRGHTRILREMDCQLIGEDQTWPAKLVNISETGASLRLEAAPDLPQEALISLGDKKGLRLPGEVIRNEAYRKGGISIGIRFKMASEDEKNALIRWLFASPEDWVEDRIANYTHRTALLSLFTIAGRVFIDEFDLHRSSPRYSVSLPCRLTLHHELFPATIIDISATGIALKVEEEPGPLRHQLGLECTILDQDFSLKGRPMWSRQVAGHWEIGIHFGKTDGQKLLQAALPQAQLKIIEVGNLQSRSLRFMGHSLAYASSIIMVALVVGIFMRNGILPSFSAPSRGTTVRFFWLSVFLILADGIKVYIEIAGRSEPRQYRSDLSQVTALIPCHNTGRGIEHTIEALQRLLPNDRILIVDDASIDQTREIARATGVRVHALEENVGKSQALTLGLTQVKTRYTLILDDDTRIQSIFLPTSLLEEGNTAVAFYILPCRRAREKTDGKDLITCIQRYEYAKSMEIGKRFQDKTLSVSCVSGAAGLFMSDRLREIQAVHSDVFPGEDLERTLIHLFRYGGQIAFVNEPVWTIAPDSLKGLTQQRLLNWYPGFYRLFVYFLKILINRKMPFRLRFEMFYNAYVVLSDPLKVFSFLVLLKNAYWGGIAFLYFFYLALEIYPFLTIEKKLSVRKYYLPAFFIFPIFGLYNAFLRFGALFYWLWQRYITKRLKPKSEAPLAVKK